MTKMAPPFFRFRASASANAPQLEIFDEIGFDGVQPKEFSTALAAVQGSTLAVEINSPGGDMFAGFAIYNMLKQSGKTVHVTVMGMAASAASIIAMAGSTITMPRNTFQMVHNPSMNAYGGAEKMREAAALLDKFGATVVSIYKARTGLAEAKIKALLSAETWLTAEEALAMGFATKVVDGVPIDNAIATARARVALAAARGGTRREITPASLWDRYRNQTKERSK